MKAGVGSSSSGHAPGQMADADDDTSSPNGAAVPGPDPGGHDGTTENSGPHDSADPPQGGTHPGPMAGEGKESQDHGQGEGHGPNEAADLFPTPAHDPGVVETAEGKHTQGGQGNQDQGGKGCKGARAESLAEKQPGENAGYEKRGVTEGPTGGRPASGAAAPVPVGTLEAASREPVWACSFRELGIHVIL